MRIGFMRFVGQDSAYVFVGDVVGAYRIALNNQSLSDKDFEMAVANGEVVYEIFPGPIELGLVMPVGHLM